MKKLLFSLLILATAFSYAQNFSGTIDFELKYSDLDEQMKPYESMLPKSMTLEMSDGMSKMTQPNGMGGETIVISNEAEGESLTLMNMMGNKIAIKAGKEQMEEVKKEEETEIELIDETKEIAGYKCKKAIITDIEGNEMTVFYTNEIPTTKSIQQMEGIDGFPLEYTIEDKMFTATTVATSVVKGKVKKIKMSIPSDYEEKTIEELKAMMGGGMGM